ncbi:MAG TPA: M1 family aminopeptidase [Candidatus Baltobacteraceae bacterium]|nr:M1 family aminopeptidase [Candidatus Baltobacteraceae bacterium]
MKLDEPPAHRDFALPGSTLRYGPDKTVDVLHIDLYLQPDLERAHLDGVCTTTVRALDEPVGSLTLDAVDLRIAGVERDGRPLRFRADGKHVEITFDPAIAPEEEAAFVVRYSVTHPRHGLFFVKDHAWTQSQDENARYWFPCLDYPHEKQTTSATIEVPKGQFALSNGALLERRDEGDRTIFSYRQDVGHSTYLTTMVVGPFVETAQPLKRENGELPVFYYVLPGREDDGARSFGKTPRMIEVFEEKLGVAYPYARYSQIAVSDFIFGGMENTSATTQTDRTLHDERAHLDFSSDPLVSHELAHQWFGDLLTCRDWSHAWLNEGFATYFEAVFREADLGYDEYVYDIFGCVERYLEEDADRYRRPIVCNRFRDPIELFDRHLYEKGGAVLHMLRGELGETRFWRAIRRYVADNAQRNVETIDLVRAIEQSTGRNMRAFFDQWVLRGGHPKITAGLRYDEQRKTLTVTVDQKQPIDASHPAYIFDVDLGIVEQAPEGPAADFGSGVMPGERRMRIRIEREHETVTIPVTGRPQIVRFDPGAFILADVTYEFGDGFAAAALAGDPNVAARIYAARELVKGGSALARAALDAAFENDPSWGVLEQVAGALGKTHAPWAQRLLAKRLKHEHPKVRRAVASALGNFKGAQAADALLPFARKDESYFVQAAALHALGRTRDERAFEVLSDALAHASWNGAIESGAARGLAELGDSRATALLVEATQPGKDESLRRAALAALARVGHVLESDRSRAVEAIADRLDDPMFLVQRSAIIAAEDLSDPRFLGALDRLSASGFDGRVRRDAAEAAIRIRESQKVPAQVTTLRSDLDALREEQRKLQEQIEAISRT